MHQRHGQTRPAQDCGCRVGRGVQGARGSGGSAPSLCWSLLLVVFDSRRSQHRRELRRVIYLCASHAKGGSKAGQVARTRRKLELTENRQRAGGLQKQPAAARVGPHDGGDAQANTEHARDGKLAHQRTRRGQRGCRAAAPPTTESEAWRRRPSGGWLAGRRRTDPPASLDALSSQASQAGKRRELKAQKNASLCFLLSARRSMGKENRPIPRAA